MTTISSQSQNHIETLFNTMDAWRHLPNYQLERRADIFFSLFINQALESKVNDQIKTDLVPEFPVHIRTIYPNKDTDKSFKIDYVAFSKDGKKAYFIELKTDNSSRREDQDDYLIAAQKSGIPDLVKGIVQIFRATTAKKKYLQLLLLLESLEQIKIPTEMHQKFKGKKIQGVAKLIDQIEVTSLVESVEIIYLQPNSEGNNILNFEEFAAIVETDGSPLAHRFARSLREWGTIKAGES
jgi:hypothetical protein